MIRGLHAMFYSSQADELRAFMRDKLGFNGTDVGDGWLIFDDFEKNMPAIAKWFAENPPKDA